MTNNELEQEIEKMIISRCLPSWELASELYSEGLLPERYYNFCNNAGGGALVANLRHDRIHKEIIASANELLMKRKSNEPNK
jgi:hypothetical protein